jgi:cytochrome c peroxidase
MIMGSKSDDRRVVDARAGRPAWLSPAATLVAIGAAIAGATPVAAEQVGAEIAVSRHLRDGEEFQVSLRQLLDHGKTLFDAVWTEQEGGGRPLTKGTGAPLSDPGNPLVFPRNFNRISAPDANSCAGCHNAPFGMSGGGGDIVTNVFVTGQRFDFATFDFSDAVPTRGALNELGAPITQQQIANSRSTVGMFGSGYIEMLARQITADLRGARDALAPGASVRLRSKGIDFGVLSRRPDGSWDVSGVEGLPSPSLAGDPPNLIVRPFHQSGAVVSLRQFTNNAFNHHHGIQTTERFGVGVDPDGDGFVNEMTRADVTAAAVFQATLPVPQQVMPADPQRRRAAKQGERLFSEIGCSGCHIPYLKLDRQGWIYTEPNPYNPAGNLQPGQAPELRVDLTDPRLPGPRLPVIGDAVRVPVFSDFKLHDITSGPGDPNREPLDINQPLGSEGFFGGNGKFLTHRLWGVANEPPYFHHGQYTTMRQAVLAHAGEATRQAGNFRALAKHDQDSIIEFLKTLQVVPPGSRGEREPD